MKTSMRNKGNFIRNNQRLLAMSLLVASIASCNKGVMEPSVKSYDNSELNATVSTKAVGNLLYSESADGSTFNTSVVKKQAYASYSIAQSTLKAYSGTKSIRFELRDTDGEVQDGTRAELVFPTSTNINQWYSYAMLVPGGDQYKPEADDEVISQWHQGGGATPALCLRTKNDHLYLRVLGDTWIDLGALDKDNWHAYVMHVIHSAGSNGLVEIWRDGTKILDRKGPNSYEMSSGKYEMPFYKLGVYKSDWNGSGTTNTKLRVLYFDDIKMGNQNATYAEMVPSKTSTTPTTPTTPGSGDGDNGTTLPTSPTTGLSVTDFKLVNSATENEVVSIANGQTISLSALQISKANIRAVVAGTAGSVKLALSGKQSKSFTDNAAPFALHGDDGGGNFYYGNWAPPALGTYTLTATPYSAANASGTAGTAKTITFTIVK